MPGNINKKAIEKADEFLEIYKSNKYMQLES